jgi:hypothetical protein
MAGRKKAEKSDDVEVEEPKKVKESEGVPQEPVPDPGTQPDAPTPHPLRGIPDPGTQTD